MTDDERYGWLIFGAIFAGIGLLILLLAQPAIALGVFLLLWGSNMASNDFRPPKP